MRPARLLLVHLWIALLVSGSAYAVITDQERYPFSPYGMYSAIDQDRSVRRLELLGISGDETEVPLVVMKQLPPWDDARLMKSFRTILHQENSKAKLGEALGDLLKQYEGHRMAGRHQDPPLIGLRLYWLRWKDIGSGNWDTKKPDVRVLAGEAMLSSERND